MRYLEVSSWKTRQNRLLPVSAIVLTQEAAIQELIAPFAAGLGDEKASMASGTEQMAVLNGAAGIVIGADGVIGAYLEAFEGSIENAGEAFSAGD
ncbi:MAG: hypothetical protein K0S35_2112 [Geminicoccaceae bacterium]|jgi:hypothetical protein|nr:hypothetical protein [Geminicoccaceae bacterium]